MFNTAVLQYIQNLLFSEALLAQCLSYFRIELFSNSLNKSDKSDSSTACSRIDSSHWYLWCFAIESKQAFPNYIYDLLLFLISFIYIAAVYTNSSCHVMLEINVSKVHKKVYIGLYKINYIHISLKHLHWPLFFNRLSWCMNLLIQD